MRHARLCAALVVLLAGCATRPANVSQPVAASAPVAAGVCRIGADGAIPLADRGIGGTGIGNTGIGNTGIGNTGIGAIGLVADRGIGGTGAPQLGAVTAPSRTAPPGTGIVGVITGFASVCLAGQEVAYRPDLPVSVDGTPATIDVLRVGQVAAIEAVPAPVVAPGAEPMALRLVVRHEVSGPLDRVEPDGALRIAGQRVLPPAEQPQTAGLVPGTWLTVSGFRREDAAIVATRLDRREPGQVLVRGIMVPAGAALRIGTIEIRPGPGQLRRPGLPVVAVGRLADGVLYADTVEPDGLLIDPGAFFGPSVTVLYVEGYAEGGVFRFGRGLRIGARFAEGRGLARLVRGPDGSFATSFVRRFRPGPFLPRVSGDARRFESAPIPDRALRRPGQRSGLRRAGGEGRGGAGRGRFAPRDRGPDSGDPLDTGPANYPDPHEFGRRR